jgi:hypothetical protein
MNADKRRLIFNDEWSPAQLFLIRVYLRSSAAKNNDGFPWRLKMDSSKQSNVRPARRNFTLYFVLILAVISAGVFFAFRDMMRSSVEQRRETSRAHLKALFQALRNYAAENNGSFPDELNRLYPKYVQDRDVFFHPAWPDRPGYVYITDLRSVDGSETIAIFENIPAEKGKLQCLALTLGGSIVPLDGSQLEQRLEAQASVWRTEKRQWLPKPVNTERLFLP